MAKKSMMNLNSLFKLFSLKALQRKINFLFKGKNPNKILLLVAILLVLFFVYSRYLKEGFEVQAESIEGEVSEGKTLALFYADWCGHCKKIKPVWDEVSKEVNEGEATGVKMIKVNCSNPAENEAQKAVMEKYNIQGYPTILVFENGKHSEYSGERTAEAFKKELGL